MMQEKSFMDDLATSWDISSVQKFVYFIEPKSLLRGKIYSRTSITRISGEEKKNFDLLFE